MSLIQLIYTSTVSETFEEKDLTAILASAKKANAEANITGLLCFDGNFFMQCLEGDRSQINATYAKILNDKRHQALELLAYSTIDKRSYSQWEMGLVPKAALSRPLNLLYTASGLFEPYSMSAASAAQFLRALRNAMPLL